MKPRYALYYAPPSASALWTFGSACIGYDADTRQAFSPVSPIDGLGWEGLTTEPRRYGFHATLKAPFRLSEKYRESDLVEALASFAKKTPLVTIGDLGIHRISGFCALTANDNAKAIAVLADAVVLAFETFRAPLTPVQRERRLRVPLSERQRAYVDAYGYPYVFEEYRFHMTLTNRLPDALCHQVERALEDSYKRTVPAGRVTIGEIALFKQETVASRFFILSRVALIGTDVPLCSTPT